VCQFLFHTSGERVVGDDHDVVIRGIQNCCVKSKLQKKTFEREPGALGH
jgi:hypothetical protein